MDRFEELLGSLQDLGGILVAEATLDGVLQRLAEVAVEAIEPCDAAGVTLVADGEPQTAAATDPEVAEVDASQYRSGSGPCLDSIEQDKPMYVRDVAREERWPDFARRAAEHDLCSVLAFPVKTKGDVRGALNMYARKTDAFERSDLDLAAIIAAQGAVVLANVEAYEHSLRVQEELRAAIRSRAVIDQAKGILMEREGVTADEAFEMLRTASNRLNVKVRDIARRIVGLEGPMEEEAPAE